jgi:DNA replication protein DnaC
MSDYPYKQPSWEEQIASTIPIRYKNTKYEDVPKNIQEMFESMKESRKGIFIHGKVGTGKTHIAYALHRSAIKSGLHSKFRNTVELFKDMRDEISRDMYSKTRPTEDLMNYEGVLILDDLGVEKATDFVVESLYLIINKRYNEVRPIILTSNFNLDELANRVGDRIPSRIVEMCHIVELGGEDKRLQK